MSVAKQLTLFALTTLALSATSAFADGTYIYKGATGTVVTASTPQKFSGDPTPKTDEATEDARDSRGH